jgi:RNA polymerase sigma-70 factor (ECF subfamily)
MSVDRLVRACASTHDSDAWDEIVCRFHRPISLSIIRTALRWGHAPKEVVDDLVQETYLKLCADRCRLLAEFAVQHPDAVIPYVKTMAVNLAHDHFKGLHSQKRGSGQSSKSIAEAGSAAELAAPQGQAAIEREVLLTQIDSHLDTCSTGPDRERDREIFWLYYQQGMSAKSIAALPTMGLTDKGVESVIFRLTQLIKKRIIDNPSMNPEKDEKGYRAAESY